MSFSVNTELQLLPYGEVSRTASLDRSRPDVSVVIICHNDAEHLPAAVSSVTAQTLKNLEILICDDASTDNTADVAARLSAADRRISYHCLPINSGGCGGPRNLGIEKARGRYIFFLDSDDTIERHACKNLLLTAEHTGSEIVSGLTVRKLQYGNFSVSKWYGGVYSTRRTLKNIAEMPELINDTTATNKLYASSFFVRTGLRFPTDMHYEDIAFSAQALAAAQGITVIPELVYNWHVYPAAQRTSITNQRGEMKNLQDRMKAVRIARQIYSGISNDLHLESEAKMLKHHLRLYLNDAVNYDDERLKNLAEVVRRELKTVSPQVAKRLTLPEKALYAAVLCADMSVLKQCILVAKYGAVAGVVKAYQTGKLRWQPQLTGQALGAELTADPLLDALTDFSDSDYDTISHQHLNYAYVVTDMRLKDGVLELAGVVNDPATKLISGGAVLRVSRHKPGSPTVHSDEVELALAGAVMNWRARVPISTKRSLWERSGYRFKGTTKIAGGASNTGYLRYPGSETGELVRLADNTIPGLILGDQWVFRGYAQDELRQRPHITGRGRRMRSALKKAVRKMPYKKQLRHRARQLRSPYSPVNKKYVAPLLQRLPLLQNTAMFESHMGASGYDNPRAVYEQLRQERPHMRFVWVHDGKAKSIAQMPKGVVRVKRNSPKYQFYLARAKYLIDNQSFPKYFVKRAGQICLQTWHGIPYKKIGLAMPQSQTAAELARITHNSAQWDLLISPSAYFERVFLPSFNYHGELISGGYPRNDELVARAGEREILRQKFDIPPQQRVVLYCPTFRDSGRVGSVAALHFELEKWLAHFEADVKLLVRSHYLNRFAIPEMARGRVVDVSDYGNIADLYLLADTLITDYSSVMFDYIHLNRPIIIYAPDYEEFTAGGRGAYFDLAATPPGAFTRTHTELFAAVESALDPQKNDAALTDQALRDRFRSKFCGVEDGAAARRAVTALLNYEENAHDK